MEGLLVVQEKARPHVLPEAALQILQPFPGGPAFRGELRRADMLCAKPIEVK